MTFNPEIFDKLEQMKELPTQSISKNCIACGTNNPEGLKMRFFTNGENVCSKVFIPESKRGWDTIVHGGVISIVMDEIMAWGAIYTTRKIIFTKTITIEYKRPIFINSEVKVASWVEDISDREAKMKGVIFDCNNVISAESSGIFTLMSGKLAAKMNMLSQESIDKFEAFLKKI
jgi:hypothetical protein